jgi:hypothetical protein
MIAGRHACKQRAAAISPSLTRRANHGHSDIIAQITTLAPGTAAGSFVFRESDAG